MPVKYIVIETEQQTTEELLLTEIIYSIAASKNIIFTSCGVYISPTFLILALV